MFKNLDWGDVWAVFGLGVAVAVASIALVFGARLSSAKGETKP